MAGPASSNKRQKNSDTGGGPPSGGNFPPQGAPYGQQYPPQGPPYNGPPGQFPMQGGYSSSIPWQSGQQPPYGSQVPYGQQGMYRSSPPLGPGGPMPGGGNWGGGRSGYNGQPPPSSNRSGSQSQGRRGGNQGSSKSPKKAKKSSSGSGNAPAGSGGPYQQGWQQQQQFPMQNQWGPGGPPQMWQGGPGPRPSPPPGAMPGQPMVPVNQNAWSGGGRQSSSPPPRSSKKSRPRSSPDPLMASGGFPQGGMMPSDVLCAPIGLETVPTDLFMTSAGVGTAPDDENTRTKPSGGSSVASREKGRGSYRCGRCGVPKKGHVCPYQPKLKRRPDEPPPEMRNAAVQVEMDEFMTLRRLNLEIQGFPESYATASHMMMDSRVIGEPHPYSEMSHMGYMGTEPMPGMNQVSVPTHVASQAPTPMKEDVPEDTAHEEQTPTSEPMLEAPVDEVPIDKEKIEAV